MGDSQVTDDINSFDAPGSFELVPDFGGKIQTLAITLGPIMFREGREKRLVPFRHLIESLDEGVRLVILICDVNRDHAARFLTTLNYRCQVCLAPFATACTTEEENSNTKDCWKSIYIRDKFSVTADAADLRYSESERSTLLRTPYGRWLAMTEGWQREDIPFWPDGGDMLTGDDFWIVNTAVYAPKDGKSIDGMEQMLSTIQKKRLIRCGFDKVTFDSAAELSLALREVQDGFRLRKSYAVEFELVTGKPATVDSILEHAEKHAIDLTQIQEASHKVVLGLYHIDLLIALTGLREPIEGQPTPVPCVLMGRPLNLADEGVHDGPPKNWDDPQFWKEQSVTMKGVDTTYAHAFEVRKQLIAAGLSVHLIPMPYENYDWYTYTNVVIENEPERRVWLPQYSVDGDWCAAYDALARKTWETLGFSVVPISGCEGNLREGGAVRCFTNVVERQTKPAS